MRELWRNIRFGLRRWRRDLTPALAVIFILALGMGATISVLSVISALLVEGLPFSEPDRLTLITGTRARGAEFDTMPISYVDFRDWRRSSPFFSGLAAFSDLQSFNLLTSDQASHIQGELVSAGYFSLLGLSPAAGRFFLPEEDAYPDARRLAIVSHALWSGPLAGQKVLERIDLTLNGERYRVVGVAPAGFRGMSDGAAVWLPMAMAGQLLAPPFLELRHYRWLSVVGRLAAGTTHSQAQTAMDDLSANLAREFPDTNEHVGVRLEPLREAWYGDLQTALWTLLAGAVLVLVVACINAANLLISRALARRGEISLRSALGAGRRRLVMQLLTESLMLALVAGALGLLLALFATRALLAASGAPLRSFVTVQLNGLVLLIAVALALITSLGFGLLPAWLASRGDLARDLRDAGRSSAAARRRGPAALVVAQVGLTLALLVGATLAAQGLARLRQSDLGFNSEELLTLRTYLQADRYAERSAVASLTRQLLERLSALPGARAASLAGPGIPTDDWYGADFTLETPSSSDSENRFLLFTHHVAPGYFSTLDVPLLAGRDFSSTDSLSSESVADGNASAPVVMISESLARRHWPGGTNKEIAERALGQGLRNFRADPDAPWLRVIGVVGEVRHRGLAPSAVQAPDLYLPLLQSPPAPPILNFLIRPQPGGDALALANAAREQLAQVDPTLPIYDVQTMAQRLDRQTTQPRFFALVMTLFALLSLLLAAIGIYSVVSYAVTQRQREIGIRISLGATRGDVVRRLVGNAVALTLLGIALGLATALGFARILASQLHGMGPLNLTALLGMSALLLVVAFVASFLPARRAARVDPAIALRSE